MGNNLLEKAASAEHKTLEERLTDFYGVPIEQVPRIESQELDWGKPMGDGELKERLLDELADLLDAAIEESFDEKQLDKILAALDEVDPIPPDTIKPVDESLKAFWEKHGYTRGQRPPEKQI